jgi:dihydroflavonol-4-reductase
LAGLISYRRNDRGAMTKVNVNGTANMISAAQRARCKRFVHFSSVTAVGAGFDSHALLNEDSPYNLASFDLGYYETKRQAEKLVVKASLDGLIDGVVLCPSNIYGKGDAQKGSRSTQLKVARGEFPFYTSGGVSVAHIDDVVKATIRASEVGRTGERYILSGENLTLKAVFHQIAELAGAQPPKIYLPNSAVRALSAVSSVLERFGKKGPVASETAIASTLFHWYDHSKASRELGFQPRSARDALADSVEYMRTNGMLQ